VRHVVRMPPVRHTDGVRPLRVLIVDAHEVSLVAFVALLRTEGFIVADAAPTDPVIELARVFEPDVVLIDPAPVAQFREVARQLRSLERTPLVVVTSSAEPDRLHQFVRQLPFLAKADVCAEAILGAVALASDESQIPTGSN
jgi:CheY-like chemotaxis protein